MQFIKDMKDGDRISSVYMVKSRRLLTTKNGKEYEAVLLQDRTGTLDSKIWNPNDSAIREFAVGDFAQVDGRISTYGGQLQLSIDSLRVCREGEYIPADYLPMSERDIEEMYDELLRIIDAEISGESMRALLNAFFREDAAFIKAFKTSSAAKSVHHAFVGGLLEHTLSVANLCCYYTTAYPMLNKDLLVAAALLHDIGKTRELSRFPENDYTDEGQLLGHIVIGVEMLDAKLADMPDFPVLTAAELRHCILAHHGEFEYGSPKKPALMEAAALHFADNTDARMETFKELLAGSREAGPWIGFQRTVDSNVRRTDM